MQALSMLHDGMTYRQVAEAMGISVPRVKQLVRRAEWPFRAWLRAQIQRDDPVGDFARDWLTDPDATRIRTFSSMDRYLRQRGVPDYAIEARDRAGREFVTETRA